MCLQPGTLPDCPRRFLNGFPARRPPNSRLPSVNRRHPHPSRLTHSGSVPTSPHRRVIPTLQNREHEPLIPVPRDSGSDSSPALDPPPGIIQRRESLVMWSISSLIQLTSELIVFVPQHCVLSLPEHHVPVMLHRLVTVKPHRLLQVSNQLQPVNVRCQAAFNRMAVVVVAFRAMPCIWEAVPQLL